MGNMQLLSDAPLRRMQRATCPWVKEEPQRTRPASAVPAPFWMLCRFSETVRMRCPASMSAVFWKGW